MKREVFSEYLGDVDTELLLQNLTNTNAMSSANIDCVREMFPRGFTVSGEFEMTVYETETERKEYVQSIQRRSASGEDLLATLIPADKMLVRLVLEPKTN